MTTINFFTPEKKYTFAAIDERAKESEFLLNSSRDFWRAVNDKEQTTQSYLMDSVERACKCTNSTLNYFLQALPKNDDINENSLENLYNIYGVLQRIHEGAFYSFIVSMRQFGRNCALNLDFSSSLPFVVEETLENFELILLKYKSFVPLGNFVNKKAIQRMNEMKELKQKELQKYKNEIEIEEEDEDEDEEMEDWDLFDWTADE